MDQKWGSNNDKNKIKTVDPSELFECIKVQPTDFIQWALN